MARQDPFDSKPRDALVGRPAYRLPVIDRTMNAGQWANLGLLAVIWGGAFFFIDVAVAEMAPLTFVWVRLTIAAAALWLYLWAVGQLPRLPAGARGAMLVLAFFNNALPFALFGWGMTRIDGGLASILNATTPIWGVLVAHFFTPDEPLTRGRLVGVALGLGGVIVMIGPDLLTSIGDGALAQLACLGGAFSYALAGVWARRFRELRIPPASVAAWQLAAGAAMMMPVALLVDRPWLDPLPSLQAWGAILALAIVCSSFAYILFFRLIERAGATNALLVTLLVPPMAILLSATFLDERLAPQHFAGLGLVALGLAAIDGRLLRRLRPVLA